MTDPRAAEDATVRVVGLRRGREIDDIARVRFEDGALVFHPAAGSPLRVTLATLDGCRIGGSQATLYLHGGDVLEVTFAADGARAVVRAAIEAASTVPELTRSLRAFGRAHGDLASAHDRWFAPLLAVRRAVVGVSDPLRQAALFDVDRVGGEIARALEELAVQQAGGDPARARALEAVLEEETEPVRVALARVALASTTLEGSAPDSQLADWRRWMDTVRELFRRADDAWPGIAAALRTGP